MLDVNKLDLVINELESSSKSILKIADIVKDTEILVEGTMRNYMLLNSLVKVINEAKDNSLLSSGETQESFISRVNTLLLEMKNENTSLYRNFESFFITQFDLLKSDVIVENRKIVTDISGIISEKINLANIDMKNNIKKNTDEVILILDEKIDKKSKLLLILVCSAIVISVGGLVTQFIR